MLRESVAQRHGMLFHGAMTSEQLNQLSSVRRLAASGEARTRRIDRRIRLREMAAALDVQPSTLSRWETGRSAPRSEVALRWAELLGLGSAQKVA
jgi:DNA-binding XRE family transcriptional regulator